MIPPNPYCSILKAPILLTVRPKGMEPNVQSPASPNPEMPEALGLRV